MVRLSFHLFVSRLIVRGGKCNLGGGFASLSSRRETDFFAPFTVPDVASTAPTHQKADWGFTRAAGR